MAQEPLKSNDEAQDSSQDKDVAASKLKRRDSFSDKAAKFIANHEVAFDIAVGVVITVGSIFLSGPLAPIVAPIVGIASAFAAKGIAKLAKNRVEKNEVEDAKFEAAQKELNLERQPVLGLEKPVINLHSHHAQDVAHLHKDAKPFAEEVGHHGHDSQKLFTDELGHHGHDPKNSFIDEVKHHGHVEGESFAKEVLGHKAESGHNQAAHAA